MEHRAMRVMPFYRRHERTWSQSELCDHVEGTVNIDIPLR